MTIISQTCGNRIKPSSHRKIRHREAQICISSFTTITKEGGTWRTEVAPRSSQITESPLQAHPFLELCCVIGDNGISMNLHRRREINGSSPSWRIKKKKNPMEPELKSRFTNPPTLSAYISRKPQRPGHRQTYAKSLRGSRGPGGRRLPQPAARVARCPRGEGRPRHPRTPARARPLHPPWDVQSKPQSFQGARRSRTREEKHLHPSWCVSPSPSLTRTGAGHAGPPPPPVSAAQARGRPRASASLPARQPHPQHPPPRTPAGAALPMARPRATAPRAGPFGSGDGNAGRRWSSP